MKTICYLRVSSRKRNGRSRQTTESQKLALRRYCQQQQVLEACRQGKYGQLIVWKLDRLGRSTLETIRTIQELMQFKIRIVVTTQGLTFDDSPYLIFLIQLFAALAELESNHASERIRAGLAVATAKGTRLGRPIDQRKRAKLQKWADKGVPVKEQAKRLGVSLASVYAMRGRMELSD